MMEYRTRKMVMSKDLNPAGTLFGGRALEWIDEEAAIFAYCQLKYPGHLVTKAMSAIDFKAPAHRGEIVEIGTETVKVGTTSITIAISLRNKRTQQEIVRVNGIVFVNLGEDGKPKPHNVYMSDDSLPKVVVVDDSSVKVIHSSFTPNASTEIILLNYDNYGMGKSTFENDRWD